MSWSPRVTHLTSTRLLVNGGIRFPLCLASARLLDMDATGRRQTSTVKDVTCSRCLKRYERRGGQA